MRLLPSEKEKAIEAAKADFDKKGRLFIYEPCNCGSHIRHNNGGNYHETISMAKDGGQYFVKYDTTCELTPESEWDETTHDKAMAIIEENADWL